MTIFYQEYRSRIIVVFIFISIFIITIVGKLCYIHIIKNEYYEKMVNNLFLKSKVVKGNRGFILDRNGKYIARNKTAFSFLVDTNNKYDEDKILELFSKTFKKPKSYYDSILTKKSNGVVLESNVPVAECREIVETQISGLSKYSKTIREYPYKELAAQVIGYTDSEYKGVNGVEMYFDDILKGQECNKKLVKNINGYLYQNPYEESNNPKSGDDITLSIDIRLQEILQDELLKTVKEIEAVSANGIIVDPFSGEVLAMANVPSLDLNKYYDYNISNHQNRSVIDSYEPGSTFKSIAIACGIEEGLIHENESFNCENGTYLYYGDFLNDHEKHENLSVKQILMHSSNIGISKIVDKNIGLKLIHKYSRNFGFGNKTGIYLPGEAKGLLKPLNSWKKSSGTFVSMGQEILGSTLQTAMAYSVFANGGYLLKPQIIRSISNHKYIGYQFQPFVVRKVISEDTAIRILRILEAVVDDGSGKGAGINGYKIAGKTGTSQTYNNGVLSENDYIASFAGIFPSDQPQYVCVVAINNPTVQGMHWGGIVAAPIIRNIFARVINEFEIPNQINYSSFSGVQEI